MTTNACMDFNGETRFGNNFNSIGVDKLSDYKHISWTSIRFNRSICIDFSSKARFGETSS